VEILVGTRVVDAPTKGTLLAEAGPGLLTLQYQRLVLATGARERFLPFPGWTLPGVLGAGGLQAMVKAGLPIAGKRVLVAGTGPLLLAVAASLRQKGAIVPLVAEQASRQRVLTFAAGLWRWPGKLLQAFALRCRLLGTSLQMGCWPVAALGKNRLEEVTFQMGKQTITYPCDYLACGFGLVPNLELPLLLGCAIQNGAVQVDAWQQTSLPDVYCAGEPVGIAGLEAALVEGQIAGHAAAEQPQRVARLQQQRVRTRRFAALLERAFGLDERLKELPQPDTIVCRCEDVTWERLRTHTTGRAAKLQTRCGMGPCQGRVCGPALEFLAGWSVQAPRPPLFPVRLSSLMNGFVDG
jgi:NADPH-dependent 2,4-dienoyl-CoA reductase/sulfur reductase-like enzyme